MNLILLKLLLAHTLGDFVLQPSKWAQDKERKKHKSLYLYLHVLIHGAILVILLGFDPAYVIAIIVISHLLIDLMKSLLSSKLNLRILFFGDQLLHLLVIIAVSNFYSPFEIDFSQLFTKETYLLLISVILVTNVSSVVMKVIIGQWDLGGDHESSLKNAGMYIGMLERIFVFSFVLIDHWEAIGFLLAAKSVFRFGDLSKSKDRKLTEYILIGTLISFGLAIIIGFTYLRLI